jgi:hypothetical protein
MPARDTDQAIERRSRELSMIWFAIIAACGVYIAVAFLVIDGTAGGPAVGGLPALLDFIFPVLAVALAAGALFYQRVSLSETAAAQQARGLLAGDPQLVGLVPLYRRAKIVTWAILEAICILGLVLAILRGTRLTILPYAGVAVILLMLTRPDLAGYLEQARALARRPLRT